MEKFDHTLHSRTLINAMSNSGLGPHPFWLNPIWLSKGPFFLEEDQGHVVISKESQIYGNKVSYDLGLPLPQSPDVSSDETFSVLASRLDKDRKALLTAPQLEAFDSTSDLYTQRAKVFTEYMYHYSTYNFGDLEGGEWKSWRQSLKKTRETLTIGCHYKNVPFYMKAQMNTVLQKWKKHRGKYIGKHNSWYVENFDSLEDYMVMTYHHPDHGLVSFNISQRVGNQIFFLDEKTLRGALPNSFTISKAYHLLCFEAWALLTRNKDLWMTSGLGSPEYDHNGHTFDLDKHKMLLKPQLTDLIKVSK